MDAALTPGLLARLLVAALALALLLGCGQREDNGAGPVVINYWEKWEGFEKEAMQEIVDAYNASQDKVFVNYLSTSQIDQKLLLATAGGNPPDVAGLWTWRLYTYAEMGALEPLDRLMERDGLSIDDYLPAVIDQCTYKGFTWALPTTPATMALHYNKKLFREAGLDPEAPPQTIAELDAMAEKLTKVDEDGTILQLGFSPNDPGWWRDRWGHWFGDNLFNEDVTKVTIASPESIAAFEWIESYPKKYGASEMSSFQSSGGQFASSQNLFLAGRLAMQIQGPWMATFVEKYSPGLEWGAAPFPSIPGLGGHVTVCEADVLVIPKGCRHPEEAWDFIKFVQRQENMERLCALQRKFSPLKEVSEGFATNHPNPYIRVFRELAESPNCFGAPESPVFNEYRDEIFNAFDLVWQLRADPAEALRAVERRSQPKLDRANAQWERIAEQRISEWEAAS